METFEKRESEPKIKNFLELKKFLDNEFGNYAWMIYTGLHNIAGVKDARELPRDKEERRRIIQEALSSTPITSDNIESVNKLIQGVVILANQEIDFLKNKVGRERMVEDFQNLLSILGNKRLVVDPVEGVKFEEIKQ